MNGIKGRQRAESGVSMKAVNLIKHLGLFGTSPVVRIKKRMQIVKEFQTCGRDNLEEIEKFCSDNNFTVTTFIVKDNTLTVNVV